MYGFPARVEAADEVSVATELQRMRSVDHLYHPQDYRLVQYSGFHRKGGNPDRMHCLYKENGWRVIADHKGPGVVSRIWTTHSRQWSDIQIEVDGKILFTGNARKFFEQKKLPFVKPLAEIRSNVSDKVTVEKEAKGKREWGVSYVPIPFTKRFRYLQRKKVYANINIKAFDTPRKIESFNDADRKALKSEFDKTAAVWRSMDLYGERLARERLAQCKCIRKTITIPAAAKNAQATVDVAMALNMSISGIIAHHSAMKDGETMKIPQFVM